MGKVIGIWVFLLTMLSVEPSNNRSGIGVGRVDSCSLLRIANFSSTKQCDEPESSSATNGRALSEMAVEVREKRKELGERDVEFSRITGSALPFFFRQPLMSAALEWLPSSFPTAPR